MIELLGEYRGLLKITGKTAMSNMAMIEPRVPLATCMIIAECVDRGWKWGIETSPRRIEMQAPMSLWSEPECAADMQCLYDRGFVRAQNLMIQHPGGRHRLNKSANEVWVLLLG